VLYILHQSVHSLRVHDYVRHLLAKVAPTYQNDHHRHKRDVADDEQHAQDRLLESRQITEFDRIQTCGEF
jgi:hypothetical protein